LQQVATPQAEVFSPEIPVATPAVPASTEVPTVTQQMQPTESTATAPTPAASQDPRYARFFRMVHVGVPAQAVKLKMKQEGLDPSVLE
jgi:WASH complex subunit CCDC53